MNSELRIKRHKKIRKYLTGVKSRPRLAVFKSGKHIYVQLIDDTNHQTLASSSDLKTKDGQKVNSAQKMNKAYEVGKILAEKALKLKVKKVVFDRGGFLYHGRIAQVAKGAREGGLEF